MSAIDVEDYPLTQLKPHPKNADLYDVSDLEELTESIRTHGIIQPLAALEDGTLISGHRRQRAALAAGRTHGPVMFIACPNEDAQLEAMMEYNRTRLKTPGDIWREAEAHKAIWERRGQKGRTTDHVAKHVGLGSGRQLERLDFVMRQGSTQTIQQLNEGELSVSAAYDQTRELTKLPPKARQAVQKRLDSGQAQNTRQALQQAKQELNAELVEQPVLMGTGEPPYATIVALPNLDYDEISLQHPGPNEWFEPSMPVLSAQELAELAIDSQTIDELAADTCLLVLWLPSDLAFIGDSILQAWGFEGAGHLHWTREGKSQITLPTLLEDRVMVGFLGTRGEFKPSGLSNWFTADAPAGELPAVFYELLAKIQPAGSALLLYANTQRKGWKQYGRTL